MASSFICPQCGHRMRGVPATGRLDLACGACEERFQLVRGRLVRIASPSAPRPARIGTTDHKSSVWPIAGGAAMTITIAFFFGALDGSLGTALVAASLGGLACALLLKRRLAPSVPVRYLSRESRAQFATAQRLSAAKGGLMLSRNEHAVALKNRQGLRQRLMGLRAKMIELALPAYGPRIESIDTGVAMLDRQIEMDRLLCEGYDRSITMIEIELEAGPAADQMNEDVSAALTASMLELKELEASQAHLARELEANVEVELLLRR